MPNITASFPHQLGKDEARRRIQSAIAAEKISKANIVSKSSEKWPTDDHLDYSMTIFGFDVAGSLDIFDEKVDVSLELPIVATMMSGMIRDQLKQEIAGLLS